MAQTVNGWTVDPKTQTIWANGLMTSVRAGDVATVLEYIAQQWHRVEKLTTFHGYRSSTTNAAIGGDNGSNHISGTATDLNGWKHPYEGGRGWRDQGFTTRQVAEVRKILAEVNGTTSTTTGVIEWGYDYAPRWRDGMHFQVRRGSTTGGIRAAATRVLRIRQKRAERRWATGTVAVRETPGGRLLKTLKRGTSFTAVKGSTVTVGGVAWVQSTSGNWVAQKYTTTKAPRHYRVTTANVNLRKSPSTSAPIVRVLRKGTKFTVLDGSGRRIGGITWIQTTAGNWVAGAYTRKV